MLSQDVIAVVPRIILNLVAFTAVVWGLTWLARRLRARIDAGRHRFSAIRLGHVELISAERVAKALNLLIRIGWWVVVLLALDLMLWRVLRLTPATADLALQVRDSVWVPLQVMAVAIWDYLPNLLTIALILLVARVLLWLLRQVFNAVQLGAVRIPGFDPAWGDPTYRLVRALAVGVVIAIIFPLLPAYNSEAFKGVSIFGGFLLAFGSSGAVGNVVAGVFLTYTRAFRIGDRVQIGETFGDVVEQNFLATRIRTDRRLTVTIPSSVVLNSAVVNYTRQGFDQPPILSTAVSIGYDAPWRKVHELLIAAAAETPDVLSIPEPFVWQRALDDFYVRYEINVSTARPDRAYWILDDLHRRIQDKFFAAGVEILSPHYAALRDGNTVGIPEASRPAGYQAPGFRISER